ncbi:HipA family kinase [Paenibacillus sp. LjRoot56]|uniref:HipA family kinase n=1 Tax=Paenibacillus sp. LjRoot56 TaxID=3342333 RepID=UPI003ECCFC71
MTSLEPIKYLETLSGKAAHLLSFNDGNRYAVKCKNNFHGTRELVNEFVIARLGQHLSLPVVPFKIVNMTEQQIQYIPKKFSSKYNPGTQFASLFIDNCRGLSKEPPHPTKMDIKNNQVLAGIFVFDHWVHNSDRTKSNILLERLPEGKYDIHMIDHGKCFPGGYKWNKVTLQKHDKFKKDSIVHIWTVGMLEDPSILSSYIEQILALPENLIEEVIWEIPEDWGVPIQDKEALITYLIVQKKTFADSVYQFAKKYGRGLIS